MLRDRGIAKNRIFDVDSVLSIQPRLFSLEINVQRLDVYLDGLELL